MGVSAADVDHQVRGRHQAPRAHQLDELPGGAAELRELRAEGALPPVLRTPPTRRGHRPRRAIVRCRWSRGRAAGIAGAGIVRSTPLAARRGVAHDPSDSSVAAKRITAHAVQPDHELYFYTLERSGLWSRRHEP